MGGADRIHRLGGKGRHPVLVEDLFVAVPYRRFYIGLIEECLGQIAKWQSGVIPALTVRELRYPSLPGGDCLP